jgi:hypothetical protein
LAALCRPTAKRLALALVVGLWTCLSATTHAATITRSVAANSDDAEEAGAGFSGTAYLGQMYLNSSDIELVEDRDTGGGYSTGTQTVGLRFTAMAIPPGATITDAYLTFRAIAADAPMTNAEPTSLTIRAQLIANAPTFSSTDFDISNRALGAASASWAPTSWTTGLDYNSPSLVSVIQEIVNQGAWASGNAIAIIITGTGHRAAQAHDTSPATAAKLVVTYAPPAVFYSVGTSVADLKAGAPTLTIASGSATFSLAQPDNVGVGDEITYNGTSKAYIAGRSSSTVYAVRTATGAVPLDVASATVNQIKRAFNSLTAAEANSSDASHLNTTNLVTADVQLNWPCYNDGPMNDGGILINGYTTGPAQYIRIFAPGSASEVGATQRHAGVAGTGFRLRRIIDLSSPAVYWYGVIHGFVNHLRIEGIEIDGSQITQAAGVLGIRIDASVSPSADIRIDKVIIHHITNSSRDQATSAYNPYGIELAQGIGRVSNTVVYAIYNDNNNASSDTHGIRVASSNTAAAYLHNNTVYDVKNRVAAGSLTTGISRSGSSTATVTVRNTAVLDVTAVGGSPACFAGVLTQSNNVSSDATAAGAGSQTGRTAYASYFASAIGGFEDLHLRSTSLSLWGANGATLSGDPNLPVTDDVDGRPRVRPDIGADEFGALPGPAMRVLSGSYLGDGAAAGRAIYVGFQPDLVIVDSDSTNANVGTGYPSGHTAVLRTSTMVGNFSEAAYVYSNPPLVDRITSFTATGFTVGHPPNHNLPNDNPGDPYHCVNHSGVRYYWTAFKAAPGQMVVSSYPGDGALTKDITTVGFRPDYTIVIPTNGDSPVERFAAMPVDRSFDFDGGTQCPNPPGGCTRLGGIQSELASGFRVGSYVNANATTYHYVAWKQTPGRIAVGSYTGNSPTDNRNITGVGFRPELVTVRNYATPGAGSTVFKPASTGIATDYTLKYIAYASAEQGPDAIQALQTDGFQVGTLNSVNQAGLTHYYAAFGPHAAQVNYRSIGPAANSSAGTVQATPDSTQVIGTGTAWKAANRGRGDRMQISGSSIGDYTVAAVASDTVLYLTVPYQGTAGAGKTYSLQRKFTSPAAWEDCIDGPLQAACGALEAGAALVSSNSLVTDDRSEVGILYNDDGPDGDALAEPFAPPALGQPLAFIDGSVTDAAHTITLTVDPGNRHAGVAWSGVGATPHVVFDNAATNTEPAIRVGDDFVTVEWIDIRHKLATPPGRSGISVGGPSGTITPSNGSLSSTIVVRNNLIHDLDMGVDIGDTSIVLDVYNNVFYNCSRATRNDATQSTDPGLIRVLGNTAWNCTDGFHVGPNANGRVVLRDNITMGVPANANFWLLGTISPLSSNNLSQDATAAAASPGGGAWPNVALTGGGGVNFVSTTVGSENLHLQATSRAIDQGASLASVFGWDIDGAARSGTWDIGADEFGATTAVKLQSFVATAGDSSVVLSWRTASELDNLGFHLYRGLSPGGPWLRLTTLLIPGLGSSAVGQAYAYSDGGLENGTRYFYRLEDVDARGLATSHGPVSAVPSASAADGDAGSSGRGKQKGGATSCPAWVVSAYAAAAGADAATASWWCARYGDPEATSFAVLSRSSREATLELRTGGFYALRSATGALSVFVPGFDFAQGDKALALPVRRALVDAVVGRRAQLGSVRALELQGFRGLVPSALGRPEMQVSRDGTVRAARRPSVGSTARTTLVTVLPSVFQGERKSAVVELSPLRYDTTRRQLVLAKRLVVRLLFAGREVGERGRDGFGRRERDEKPPAGEVLARLYTTSRGLHAVSFEQLLPGQRRGMGLDELRLERQGEAVAFHVEPSTGGFAPGSVLYFFAEAVARSTDFAAEVAWELVRGPGGVPMPLSAAAPGPFTLAAAPVVEASFEVQRYYQPGLLEATDPWLWEAVASGATKALGFTLAGVATSAAGTAGLDVDLQGASESGNPVDHHVAVAVNGVPVGEARFAGKRPHRMRLTLQPSVLREGANELSVTNVADTGVSSFVFVDRFSVAHPHSASLAGGRWEGQWPESGSVGLSAAGAASVPIRLVDVSGAGTAGPVWLTGFEGGTASVRFSVEAGHRYWLASPEGLLSPRVVAPKPGTLRAGTNQSDYLLIAPQAFLAAAQPLLQRRQEQGLTTRGVALEQLADEFGHGRPSAEAIRSFIAYAYQSWARPSPGYVLLLGDASYDPRNFIGTSKPSPLPALFTKTSYLWTASDPLLGAANGEDGLPDLAIGRLPAATLEEAERLVAKLLAWEDSGQGLRGMATLVADDPDLGGDFEANVRDVADGYLAGRSDVLLLRELGGATRPRIQEALDAGRSYLDYVGHGGAAVWASENVWNSWDAASLRAQSQQPLLVTMNCLNGYFVAPAFDSLSESLVKAEGRGAIAAFSPSGLSLDAPAHQYHRALLAELTSGKHARLGDALLVAQQAYARSGLMPELLAVYHLLGDPATPIQ